MKVAIEGAPGVGKSTLCQQLAALIPDSGWVQEPVAENSYLMDYYANPARWALAMQIDVLMRRASSTLSVASKRHNVDFYDRSAWGDRLFARTARSLGLMESREFDTYDSVFRTITATHSILPDTVVYLRASSDVLWERVQARGRPAEGAMTRAYLDAIHGAYDALWGAQAPLGTRVITLDWNQYGKPEAVWAAIEKSFTR